MLSLNSIFIYSRNFALVEIIYIILIFNRTNNFPSFLCLEQACAKKKICVTHFNYHRICYAVGEEQKIESQAYCGFCSSFLILTWMNMRTPFNIPVDVIPWAFQMYSIYLIHKTNEEEQNATAYVHFQTWCTSPPIGEAGDQSQCCNCLWSAYWFADSFVHDICIFKPHMEKGECAMSFQLQGCSLLSIPQWQRRAALPWKKRALCSNRCGYILLCNSTT